MINLPNLLACIRVLIAPILFWILINANSFEGIHISWINYFAALLFVLASVTDFFDGYIARRWNQITKFGSIIDPLADKMLTLAAFMGLMYIDRASAWAIYIILVREFFITGFRVVMAAENVDISAGMAGKIKTVLQMVAIGFLIMQWRGATLLLWGAVMLTVYSGFEYILAYIRHIKNRVV